MLLKLKNIGKIYDSNDILTIGIRNINLKFDFNEFVIIEGESGSGKSTLLNVIGANDTYEEGELFFNSMETSHYSASDWEKYREQNISTVFQDFNIISSLTVLENVEIALLRIDNKKERRRIAKELIGKVGLSKQMNQRGSRLSGGEKQRTVIARALAKDSPVILADEPTGNLDVKSSREIAKLLKDVAKDKLVIVVTHNPEYFNEYATRKIRIYDGGVSEDKRITEVIPPEKPIELREYKSDKKQDFKNALLLGALNYKSRPRFSALLSISLLVCIMMIYFVFSFFSSNLIKPIKVSMIEDAPEGTVVVSKAGSEAISLEELNEIAVKSGAKYKLIDSGLSGFDITITKKSFAGLSKNYNVKCIYDPYKYSIEKSKAILVTPYSSGSDADLIKDAFINANTGIQNIKSEKVVSSSQDAILYLSYEDLIENGKKIQAIFSNMRFNTDSITVYTFAVDEALKSGEVNLINSKTWNIKAQNIVFEIGSSRQFLVNNDEEIFGSGNNLIVKMSTDDYNEIFNQSADEGKRAYLYFSNDSEAKEALKNIGDGYLCLLANDKVYIDKAGDQFAYNCLYYGLLVIISFILGMIINLIFMRSVKIYTSDFTVFKTLGISQKVSSKSLYFQMALVFAPTLILLPLISLITTITGYQTQLIGFSDYLFIELLGLVIVEYVAYGFSRSINKQSIRKSLKRGSK